MGARLTLVSAMVLTCLVGPATASAYQFGEPGVRQTGPETLEFDYSAQKCDAGHIPDAPVRAFRDSTNRVQLIMAHESSRRLTGSSLDSLSRDCSVLMSSSFSADPSTWNDREWLSSPYTTDGQTVHALVHEEFQGYRHPGMCSTTTFNFGCWYNAITLTTSTNGGNTYAHATPPAQHVASSPWPYVESNWAYGLFQPSNIVYKDGWYYALLQVEAHLAQKSGACLMRSQNLADPDSWRAWDGTGFNVRFIDPYVEPAEPPEAHVCEPVSEPQINKMVSSVTWNSYFRKWLLVGTAAIWDPVAMQPLWGAFYSVSDDLVNWSDRKLLFSSEMPWSYECGDDDPTLLPVVLDPDSTSRNFETTDQQVYLYFTRYHYVNCAQTMDRDLVRIPIEFSNQVPGGPAATFTATPSPVLTNDLVTFDASASSDPDGLITRYEWDLDGDGTFETDTGLIPTASLSYADPGTRTVWLRVTDDAGNSTDTTRKLTVQNRSPAAALTSAPNPSDKGQAVSFSAAGSSDPDGTIVRHQWDLDGNGSFETDTGTTPTASRTYTASGSINVRVRVTDNNGATADAARIQTVRFSGKFNFQPSNAAIPAGYTVDSGAAWTAASGRGWIRQDTITTTHTPLDMTKNTADRNTVSDQRLDTLIFMQSKLPGMQKTAGAWELAVPNGSYAVTLSVGDAKLTDSTHRINVEGVNAINNFNPTSAVRFASATRTVTVSDGRLTVDATGGTNTKLNYVDVTGL